MTTTNQVTYTHPNPQIPTLTYKIFQMLCKGKGKAVPLQDPDYMTTAQDGGEVVSPTHRPPLPPGNAPGTRVVC